MCIGRGIGTKSIAIDINLQKPKTHLKDIVC